MDRSDQDDDRDRIEARDVIFDSPWVRLVSKAVVLMPGAPPERYFVLDLPDYVSICPRRRDGRFLLVRQYRPAVEQFLWEFPAGIVDPGETPEISVTRELIEETGHRPLRLVSFGAFFAESGRLCNRGHLFFGEVEPAADWTPEPGVTVMAVDEAEIDRMVADGRLNDVQQVALWLMVKASVLTIS